MASIVKIKKGLTINLYGEAEKSISTYLPDFLAVKPDDFRVFSPKLLVSEGDTLLAGSPVMFDKSDMQRLVTSPVSGKVFKVVRGEKRKLESIIIENDKTYKSLDFGKAEPEQTDREQIAEKLLKSGLWMLIRQRPYGIIANPVQVPDAIFISGFDSAPLAADMNFVMSQYQPQYFQKGIDILKKLTSGNIHLNVNPEKVVPEVFLNTKNVIINQFTGSHPSGNIGTQIHHIRPLMKGDLIWYLYPQDVVQIGYLFAEGKVSSRRIIANTGSELIRTGYIDTLAGVSLSALFDKNLKQKNVRIISGNVLTGKSVGIDGYLGYYDTMLTTIPEGDYYEFFGWAAPGFKKFSISKTFFAWLFPKRKYRLDTNKHGEIRAFVVNGEYEKIFPFQIMPVNLLKATIAKDIDKMEQLGIYEVVEEDFALCEVVCTSKIESQEIIRDGIDFMLKEMN